MPEYIPTTQQIRDSYRSHDTLQAAAAGFSWEERGDEFDRWLAAHDREVAARTLEAAADDYYGDTHIPGLSAMTWLRERAATLRPGTEGGTDV